MYIVLLQEPYAYGSRVVVEGTREVFWKEEGGE